MTLERIAPHRAALGITRLANITGLDYLGVPVFAAMRPNAKSISVSQGKGITADAAAASALMEAIEVAHAERAAQLPVTRQCYRLLARKAQAADPHRLPRLNGRDRAREERIAWVEGRDLQSGESIFVPHDLVHTDFTRRRSRMFAQSSNGLASGNEWLEAVVAALCEVIERDAVAIWECRSVEDRARGRIVDRTIRDRTCRTLIDNLAERGMGVSLWNATTDIGVATILCRLTESVGNDRSSLGPFWGMGCHLDRGVALLRAVTEAAQTRLTYIAGVRDDLPRRLYNRPREQSVFAHILDVAEASRAGTCFSDIPSLAADTFDADVRTLLARLARAGLGRAIVVDLTDKSIGIPVVRVIVPGLEIHHSAAGARAGSRLLRARAAAA